MEYNISKIQLKIMCRFCRNIDLGVLHFYFSSKKCSSKVYTSLEKVIVLATLSTEKLSLQFLNFSVIGYGFYKFQLKHTKSKESFCEGTPGKTELFADLPLVCAKAPRKKTC
jgi:hypothetical protein